MKSREIAVLYTTIVDEAVAENLANIAIVNRLAACVNIFPEIKSMYYWEGGVEKSRECGMMFKTTTDLVGELEKVIVENHPYETPCVLKYTPKASQRFKEYIFESVREP